MDNLKQIKKYMKKHQIYYFFGLVSVIISQLLVVASPIILQTTIDNILQDKDINNLFMENTISKLGGVNYLRENLWVIGLILILFTCIRGIFFFLRKYLTGIAAEETIKNLRNQLYDHIQKLPYDFHVKSETGELIQRCTSDVETLKRFLSIQLVEFFSAFCMIFTIIITMAKLNTKMTLASIIILPFTFLFSVIFFKLVKKDFTIAEEKDGSLNTILQENLTGVRVVKAFNKQNFEIEKFDKINAEYKDASYKITKNMAKYWGISDLLSMSQVGVIVVYGSILTYNNQLTLGEFTAFATFINMLVWPVRQMGRNLTEMGKANVSLSRINEILSKEIENLNEFDFTPEINGDIEFKNVSFSYDETGKTLKNISFHAKKGDTIALLGPTGSGKTTLVSLLSRLYEYEEGSILIDGNELSRIDKSHVRKNVGLVLQEPFLYSKKINENIKQVNPEFDNERVISSAKIASVHDDITSFDKGYDTIIGEKGSSLSGGQKQRVAIARTIINNYPIVVFDDSLSAVDTKTDIQIRTALENRKHKSTTFIISHRVSTAKEADLIVILKDGEIDQIGKHNELISIEGSYKDLYLMQNPDTTEEV